MIEGFVTYLEAERRYSPYTVRNYRRDVEMFIEHLDLPPGEFHPGKVTVDDIRSWIVAMSDDRGLSPASINYKVTSVRSFFRWLRAGGIVEGDPFRGIKALRTPKRLPVWIPEKQMDDIADRLLERCEAEDPGEKRNALIVLLFYSCGLRLAELMNAGADDLSDDGRSLRVHGKGDKTRIVPLPDPTATILKRHISEFFDKKIWQSGKKPLFLTEKGKPLSRAAIYNIVRAELESMGVVGKRSPHVLRHTFATALMDGGADMRDIQELMGHTSLAATQVYTHTGIAGLKKAYKGAHPREKGI